MDESEAVDILMKFASEHYQEDKSLVTALSVVFDRISTLLDYETDDELGKLIHLPCSPYGTRYLVLTKCTACAPGDEYHHFCWGKSCRTCKDVDYGVMECGFTWDDPVTLISEMQFHGDNFQTREEAEARVRELRAESEGAEHDLG